ncbi:LAFA_0F04280g1_1 [Lachancea sp. 'fantastica']|nr:LAFA_0F04280g1_1 [Lachancea sp. 'fantastica']
MGLIKKVAVIGGGPAGLLAAESLARQEDQNWEIVGFEARSQLGGVWSDTPGSNLNSEQVFQQLQLLGNVEAPLDPATIFQKDSPLVENGRIPNLRPMLATSVNKPMCLKRKPLLRDGLVLSSKTGVYDNFMTNAPRQLMDLDCRNPLQDDRRDDIAPLEDLQQVQENVKSFVEKHQSSKIFRLNTSVEYLDKLSPLKWIIIAKTSDPRNDTDSWYSETFDAVVIANGHFMCPYVPYYMSSTSNGDSNIHEFNKSFPDTLSHVRDIDVWYQKRLPLLHKASASRKQKIVIVGKSFSAMDILKRLVPLQDAHHSLEIIISTKTPPNPENTANPFCWFDKWLTQTTKVTTVCAISQFFEKQGKPALRLEDGSEIQEVSEILFATGYLYSFPFVSNKLLENYRILLTPDPRCPSGTPSNISRVTGLYLHTFSIADPTMGFVGISSNANFQSFQISAQALAGAWSKVNYLYETLKPQDGPIYDSIWSQVLPSVQEQLKWCQERLLQTGNNGAYHFYFPLNLLKEQWLKHSEPLFTDKDRQQRLFPEDSAEKAQSGLKKLEELFLQTVEPNKNL